MNKQYRHKLTGKIAELEFDIRYYLIKNESHIPSYIVENSNDWEEIKEVKEEFPKIVSFRNKNSCACFLLKDNGKFAYVSVDGFMGMDDLLKKPDFEIYQVATSPTETFTLGDRVTYNYKANYAPWIIDNFLLRSDGKILARSNNTSIVEYISEIKKVKEPIFVTEDNYEIFIKDSCHLINTSYWQLFENMVQTRDLILPSWMKAFKDLEKAKKYLEENKPRFSKKQLTEALKLIEIKTDVYCTNKFKTYVDLTKYQNYLEI
jgi:hypothetical protein